MRLVKGDAKQVTVAAATAADESEVAAVARDLRPNDIDASIGGAAAAVARSENGHIALVGLHPGGWVEDAYTYVDTATRTAGAADGDGAGQRGRDL